MNHFNGYDDPTANVLEAVRLERAQVAKCETFSDTDLALLLRGRVSFVHDWLKDRASLRTALIKIAALCVAWVEAIDQESRR